MKRSILLLLVLILLGGIAYWLTTDRDDDMTRLKEERSFAVENPDEIGKIIITERDKNPRVIMRAGKDWVLEDGVQVRKHAMRNVLETLTKIQVKQIPNTAAYKNIMKEMALIGVRVQIFDRGENLIKDYYVGGSPADERGTYMIKEGSQQPFVVHLPSLDGSVRGRFRIPYVELRHRLLYDEDVEDITKVSIQYFKDPTQSFSIQKSNNQYEVKPLSQYVIPGGKLPNQDRVKAYIGEFEELQAEYLENDNQYRDSIVQLVPFCEIVLEKNNQETKSVKFFPVSDIIFQHTNTVKTTDADLVTRYFAESSNGDFLLVQQRLVGKYLRPFSFFFE